jgi:predicted secreted protein
MASLSGKTAKIRITSIGGASSTDNAATRSTGVGTGTGYVQINSAALRRWDNTVSSTGFKVWRGSSQQSASLYEINYVQGKFQWLSGDPTTGTYTIDAITLTNSYMAGGRGWEVNVEVDELDVTTFSTSTADKQWRDFIAGLSGWEGTIDRLHPSGATGPVFYDHINLESPLVAEFILTGTQRFEGYCRVEADNYGSPIDQVITEGVTLRGDGPLYFST